MRFRPRSIKGLAILLGGLLAAYLLFGWLVLPGLLQQQAEKYIAEKTGHRLTLDRPEFNPLTLHLRLANLRLVEPDGQPLLVFRELQVGISAASLHRRALVFSEIRLDAPQATVTLLHDGRLNWAALIDGLKGKEKPSDASATTPRLDIEHFVLTGGRIDFADQRTAFATRVNPIEIELNDISTLPDDKGGYKISAHTGFGARLEWQGQATLAPLALAGKISLDDVDLAKLTPYYKGAPIAPGAGKLNLATDYRLSYDASRIELNLDHAVLKATGLRLGAVKGAGPVIAANAIEIKNGRFDLARNSLGVGSVAVSGIDVELPRSGASPLKALQHAALAVADTQVDLTRRTVAIRLVTLKDGQVQATRAAQGHIDLVDAWHALSQVATAPVARQAAAKPPRTAANPKPAAEIKAAAAADAAWHYRLEKFELSGFSAAFSDQSVAPAASMALTDIALAADGISDNLAAPLPVRAAFHTPDGGTFEATGQVIAANPSADINLKLMNLGLKPAQPYLASVARLTLQGGQLSANGEFTYAKGVSDFQGGFALRDLRLTETESGEVFLAWKSLATEDLEVGTAGLAIGDIALDGLDTKLIINKDKSVNFSRIRTTPTAAGAAPPAAAAAPAPAYAATAPPAPASGGKPAAAFPVSVDRLQISHGEMDYTDNSLALTFGTRINHLRGAVVGISSTPGELTQLDISGQVDDYGSAHGAGKVNLFHPTDFMDITVQFQNVEMTGLTPYTATFAGRKIDSGKLSLDLQYKIEKRQLLGSNRIIMDQLILGERVESPQARDWPLDLAIAILQDSDGRIDLGLPVSGNLEDPQFSYGGIIWKAIEDVFEKVATAPFRMLGSLFGGDSGDEKATRVVFAAGARGLAPPEREKLITLANALNKRPSLSLTIQGQYADADRAALQDRQTRRAVIEKTGEHVEGQGDPGPISTQAPKTQTALESLFSDRFGMAELTTLKTAFNKANPGQLQEGVGSAVKSKFSGLLHPPRAAGEDEVAAMKGADFHAMLFERLHSAEKIDDSQLLELAKTRGDNALAALKTAGAPMDRLTLGTPEKITGAVTEVELKLTPGATPVAAAKPAG